MLDTENKQNALLFARCGMNARLFLQYFTQN